MGLPTTKRQSAKLVELSEEGVEDDATLEITSATN
jgi:hypothetical protein